MLYVSSIFTPEEIRVYEYDVLVPHLAPEYDLLT